MAIRLSELIRADREFLEASRTAREQMQAKKPLPMIVNGLSGGAVAAFLSEILRDIGQENHSPALILVENAQAGEKLTDVLTGFGLRAAYYPKRDLNFHNITASHDIERERLSVLNAVSEAALDCVVATPSAALSYTMPEEELLSLALRAQAGDMFSPSELAARLSKMAFSRVDLVEGAGQYAVRGGIVDFCRNTEEGGIRVEFFDDEIDRIAGFDLMTQRSTGALDGFSLFPATEALVDDASRKKIAQTVEKLLSAASDETVRASLAREKATIEADLPLDFRDKYFGLIYAEMQTLLSFLSTFSRTAVFVLGTNETKEECKEALGALKQTTDELISAGLVTKEAARYAAGEDELERFCAGNFTTHINSFSTGLGSMRASGLFGFRCRRTVNYGGNPTMLKTDLDSLRRGAYRVLIVCPSRDGARALCETLFEDGITALPAYEKEKLTFDALRGGQVAVTVGEADGFELMMPKVALLSMARDEGRVIMANRRRQRLLKKAGGSAQQLLSYADLTPGDYVVHASYGIGRFVGIVKRYSGNAAYDYMQIRYAGEDELFVPCDRLETVGKYIGDRASDGTVKLSKLGGGEWQRTKARAKAAAKDIAKELIVLYAERQRKPGFAFPDDCEMEREFADAFEFEETDSQLTAIEEIKKDMMKPVPMNRLLCGDVGFGKTEVALRAAFKAVVAGKQVAILVPTTILALQHFETALSRMRGYAVTVEMISRLRSPKECETILRRVKRGEVDILIGTHKLLSKAVEFRDLGLLIIDEEQRFGVVQKEKLKEMAKNVDCLTLTATPIPRTLNMAMSGISDMSILDEAPGERRPVQTYVLEHDDLILNEAMRKELERGGQVFYLYNKVEDIDLVAGRIMKALPEARVAYAHGQMEKDEIEDIWQSLVRGEIDILVSTTIIETGVDLPNANTLIIENADRMGLSQLHQIRGRVGRSGRQAYAYFTFRKGKALSEVAEKRLSAIREFAEFGAGFKIALRDMEIRGAGNLLGSEQHGYIESVGYELYMRLLSEAVLEEQGGVAPEVFEATVEMHADAYLPESYIPSTSQRLEIYKKISLILTEKDMEDVADEMLDRFGDIPMAAQRLLRVALIRAQAVAARIRRVSIGEGEATFSVDKIDLAAWSEIFGKYEGISFRQGATPTVVYRDKNAKNGKKEDILAVTAVLLSDYADVVRELAAKETAKEDHNGK